jgi:hypothetical protein
VAAAIRARDKTIVEAHGAGASFRVIACWSGLNHETVRTIVRREKEEHDAS